MATFAKTTDVRPEKSRQDIEDALRRYGATAFGYAVDDEAGRAVIQFRLSGRLMRLSVPLPDPNDPKLRPTANNGATRNRTAQQAQRDGYEQALRQRWRALVLFVKAALEAVEAEALTVDEAFLSAIVTPNGQTLGELYAPQIERAIEAGQMPPLLPGPK